METRASRGFVNVGRADRGRRSARAVALFHHGDAFHAIDANCYHAAGSLEKVRAADAQHTEDIEEILGQPCIMCPQHKYVISIATGESFYEAVDVVDQGPGQRKKIVPLGWRSKGVMQRTHEVRVERGNVYVRLSDLAHELPSDKYAYI